MKKLLPFMVIILVVLGVVVCIPLLLQSNARKQQVSDYLSKLLHHKVVIGKLDTGFFPPAFELHNVAAFADGADAPALQVDHATVAVGLSTLFGGALAPTSLTLDHLSFQSHRRANGTWDMDEWLPAFGAVSGGGTGSISHVIIHDSEGDWLDPFGPSPRELMLKSINGDMARGSAELKATLSGAGVVETFLVLKTQGSFSSTWTGDVTATDQSRQWTAHVSQQPGHFQLTGQSAEWRWDPLVALTVFFARLPVTVADNAAPTYLQNWKLEAEETATGFSLVHSAALGGGVTEAKAQWSSSPVGVSWQGALATKNVALQTACSPIGGCGSMEGALTFTMPHFALMVTTGTTPAITADGAVELRDGVYHVPDTSAQHMARTHMLKYFKLKYPGLLEKGFTFQRAHAQGSLAGGVLSIRDASLSAPGLQAGVVGTVEPFKKAIDAFIRLQISESSPDRLQYIPGKYISGMAGHERVQPIFGRFQGTWDEWILRSLPNYKIPPVIQNQLKKSMVEKP